MEKACPRLYVTGESVKDVAEDLKKIRVALERTTIKAAEELPEFTGTMGATRYWSKCTLRF